jgi:hypothetical protein
MAYEMSMMLPSHFLPSVQVERMLSHKPRRLVEIALACVTWSHRLLRTPRSVPCAWGWATTTLGGVDR